MNKKKYLIHLLFPVLAVIFLFSQAEAKIVKFTRKPRFSIEISTIYDNNIFLYSEDYLADFKNQVRSYRFPFSTYDDFIVLIHPSLRIPFAIGKIKPTLYFNYKQYLYSVNAEKSYQTISATLIQPIIKSLNLEVSYLFLPRYLIRYYRNPIGSTTDYIGCTFSENLATAKLNYRWQKFNIKPFIRYEIDDYKENFHYYNGNAIRYGVDVLLSLHKLINVNIGYERKDNYADGPIPDISYNENRVNAQILIKAPNFEKLSLIIGGENILRKFTTNNSFDIDPFHSGRKDTKSCLDLGVNYRISPNLQMNINYSYEIRSVTTPYQIDIEEIKDYNNNRISLGLKFNPIMLSEGD